ncbi:MAG: phospho-N-acetylmuramoyl-pentapeptide-transferase [Synergistaceae bacterium]|jgi:phospho-N-acetylmuramoyl-pentapeptide-transferase|nr:phospho-N-acetylmuramoyl-pentapeptide-transferase [Synergistaceae bacterium]
MPSAAEMRYAVAYGIVSFLLGLALQYVWIRAQRKLRVTHAQKSYGVGIDVEVKASTPTMGGVVFIVLALAALLAKHDAEALLFWALPVACGLIGFVDDWLKFTRRSSEGFRSLRKLFVQVIVAVVWVVWASLQRGLFLWPGLACPLWIALPLSVVATVGMMNAVNVTDGLDGLAGGAFLISLAVLGYLLPRSEFDHSAFAVLFGMAAAFLIFNARPALVFMGDAGSHFLGGALVALCVQGGVILGLVAVGFLFGVELLSSAVQIAAIRGLGRKVFRMAPLHHHFQLMGWDETTVTTRFLVIHAACAALLAALGVAISAL